MIAVRIVKNHKYGLMYLTVDVVAKIIPTIIFNVQQVNIGKRMSAPVDAFLKYVHQIISGILLIADASGDAIIFLNVGSYGMFGILIHAIANELLEYL